MTTPNGFIPLTIDPAGALAHVAHLRQVGSPERAAEVEATVAVATVHTAVRGVTAADLAHALAWLDATCDPGNPSDERARRVIGTVLTVLEPWVNR